MFMMAAFRCPIAVAKWPHGNHVFNSRIVFFNFFISRQNAKKVFCIKPATNNQVSRFQVAQVLQYPAAVAGGLGNADVP